MRGGLTEKIRACLSALPQRARFSASKIARVIGEPNALRVQAIFADLVERKEIIKEAPGSYRYIGTSKLWKKKSALTDKILRAMHVKKAFSAREVALLSDCKKNTVYKVIRQLYAHDELIKVGMDKNINGQKEVIHKLKDRDSFYLKHIMKNKKGENRP
ncbi:MAG: hypothetical protein WAW37_06890 [Syntrophobacteraceae bacterium]